MGLKGVWREKFSKIEKEEQLHVGKGGYKRIGGSRTMDISLCYIVVQKLTFGTYR